ncbi:MAG: TIGR03905 family TSCPD domain-containing protein [Solobacterium sp.]|nr:TIGR03905 family TSCPD domain-containing protein [Solobacterium sp.]
MKMSERFTYRPSGVCSQRFDFVLDGDKIESLQVTGGCNGNLKGIAKLIAGRSIDEVVNCLEGTTCSFKGTSCPDQIAKALKTYQNS